MKCKEVQASLSLYLDHELSGEEEALIQNHLEHCSLCQGELVALRETILQLSSLAEVNPPASFRRELYAKLEKSIAAEAKVKNSGLLAKLTVWRQHVAFYPVAIALVLLIILVPAFLNGPRMGSQLAKDSSAPEMMSYGVSSYNLERDVSPLEQAPQILTTTENATKQVADESKLKAEPLARKLIKNAELYLLADDYEQATEALKTKVSALDGYITNETVNVIDARGSKRGYLVVRIPQMRFDEFLAGLNDLGKLKRSNIYTQDVTEEYIDVESRLKTMRTKEERLLDILQQSGNLNDVLAVENELANTRAQLESLEGRLRYLSNQTEFSTFNLEIEQVVASTQQVSASGLQGVGARAKEAFIKAINNIFLGLGATFVFISAAIPYLVVVAILGFLIWMIWRGRSRK